MLYNIFELLILFQIKHFIADYPLQNKYMLKKFLPNWGFFFPLLAHAGVHAGLTLAICLFVYPNFWWLSLVDLVVHFVMDRIKAGPKYLGRFKALSGDEIVEIKNNLSSKKNDPKAYGINLSHYKLKLKGNTYFWWSLGFDQMVHHITHYFIILMLILGNM